MQKKKHHSTYPFSGPPNKARRPVPKQRRLAIGIEVPLLRELLRQLLRGTERLDEARRWDVRGIQPALGCRWLDQPIDAFPDARRHGGRHGATGRIWSDFLVLNWSTERLVIC